MEKDELIKRVEELQRENRRLEEVLERNGLNDSIKDKSTLAGIENRLKERESFFRDIAESMSDIMWEIDSEWRYTFVAGKLEKYIGYTPDDLIGITPFDLMAEDEADAFLQVLEEASQELSPITDVEATVKTLDGKDSTFLVNAVPVIRDGVFAGYRGVVKEISDRKRIEKALMENERNLSIMMSNLPGMFYRCRFDERRTMEFVSDGIIKLTGYRPEDVTGNALIPYSGIINPDDRDMVRQVVTMSVENRISFELNYRIICSDKSDKWVLEKGQGVFNENGELLYIEGFITDITERVLVEEKIRRSEERMRILFEKNPQGILIADRNGNIINANSSWLKMFGYTYKDIQGLTAFDVRPLSEHETAGKLINSLFSGDVLSHHVEGLFLKKGGAEFWCDLTAGIISDPVSGENYAIVVYNDIDERKKMEKALAESELKNRILLEESPIGISLLRDGIVIFANTAYAAMFGYDKTSDLMGMMLGDLLAPELREELTIRQKSRQRGFKESESFEAMGLKKNGEVFPFHIDVVRIELGDGPATLGFIQDITERKKNESELKKFHDELELLVSERTSEILKLNMMLINSQEEERQRIAKDLHDGVGQTILAAKFALNSFMKSNMRDHDVFDRGMLLIDMSSQELREVYSGLYPSMLRELGLGSTVKWCIRNYLESAGISVDYYVNIESAVEHQTAINIYRIMQELFNNILKHSHAAHARVAVFDSQELITIEVEDDGCGFHRESVTGNASGSGLFNIGQRISLLHGKLDIDSGSGYTSVRIEIPLEKK